MIFGGKIKIMKPPHFTNKVERQFCVGWADFQNYPLTPPTKLSYPDFYFFKYIRKPSISGREKKVMGPQIPFIDFKKIVKETFPTLTVKYLQIILY